MGWALLATIIVALVEVGAGLLGNSLALMADAGHVAVDVLALSLAWWATAQAAKPPTQRQTYGYQRVGILVGLGNALLLLLVVSAISAGAALRLDHPERPVAWIMIGAALFGVAANLLVAALIHRGHSFNSRAAMLHVGGDILAGIGVVLAALLIQLTGWLRFDPLISLAICAVIAWGALRLLREALPVLLESAPRGISVAAVEADLLGTPGVDGVHDLHVWQLTPDHLALSCHLALREQTLVEAEHLVQGVSNRLCRRYGLGHTTIQVEACHPCPPGLCSDAVAHFDNHQHAEGVTPGASSRSQASP